MSRRVPLSIEGGQGIWTVPQAGGVRIRSIQRGETQVTASPTDITISPVDLTKAVVIAQGLTPLNPNPNLARSMIRLTLVSPTVLRCLPWDTTSIDGWTQWQVVEFDGLRSLQSGITNLPIGSPTINQAISSVNLARAALFYTFRGGSGANLDDWSNFWARGTLTSSTNIRFTKNHNSQHGSSESGDAAWFVVEF